MVSRLIKGAALIAASATLSTYAAAQYGSSASYGSGATPAPAQSYGSGTISNTAPVFAAPAPAPRFTAPAPAPTYGSSASYTSASSPRFSAPIAAPTYNSNFSSTSNTFAGVASPAYADATYGTGSISNAYTGSDVEIFGFSGAPNTVAGLGHNESLSATNCPTNVYNPDGGRVLGCYNVVKPVVQPVVQPRAIAQTSYYRVVRPVIYVRYPVPCCAPRPVIRPVVQPVVQPCCAPKPRPQPVCNTKVKPAWSSRYGANGFPAPQAKGCGW